MIEAAVISSETWIKIGLSLATLAAGVMKLAPWIYKTLDDRARKRNEASQIKALRSMARMFTLMSSLTTPKARLADRVIVFAGHNGGSMPEAGKPYYVSAINSELGYDTAFENRPENRYQEVAVDRDYVNLLLDAYDEEYVHLLTDEMPTCLLRDYYLSEGVVESFVFFLRTTGHHFIYASVANTDKVATEGEVREIQRVMNMVKTSINNT